MVNDIGEQFGEQKHGKGRKAICYRENNTAHSGEADAGSRKH